MITSLLSVLLGSMAIHPMDAYMRVTAADWVAHPGTHLIVDTQSGSGFLINPYKRTYYAFPLAIGKRGTVCHEFLGCYNGTTPEGTWVISGDVEIKGHWYFRTAEGKSGRFFRFYKITKNGDETLKERTAYGIHTIGNVEAELAAGRHHWSYGCVVMSDHHLDLIHDAYRKNGGTLTVKTKDGEPFSPFSTEVASSM